MDTGQMKKETLNIANCIEIDKDKAKSFLGKKGNYRQPGVHIEKWKAQINNQYFAAYLEKNKFSYLGLLNSKLKREKYGINTFDNGDKYIGNFENDKREENGVYVHLPLDVKDYQQHEIYLGNWKDNTKYLNGSYIWLKEKKDSIGYEMANLDVFFGEVDQDNLKRGCYLSKIQEKNYAYYGKFDANGTKSDEKAYFYDYSKDKVFCGKIQDNKFKYGYLLQNGKNGNPSKLIYIEFDEADNMSSHKTQEMIEEKIREQYITSMSKFRQNLLNEDYFISVYNKFSEIRKFIERNSVDVSILNDEKQYQNIVDISTSHKDFNLFSILENNSL